MHFDHDEEHLFISNDRTKTMEQLIEEFRDMPTEGADVVFNNRSHDPENCMYPELRVRFRNSSSPDLYEYLYPKLLKANSHMNHFRAAMFSEDVNLLCEFNLKNWQRVAP